MANFKLDDEQNEQKVIGYELRDIRFFHSFDINLFAYAVPRKIQGVMNDLYSKKGITPTVESLMQYSEDPDVRMFIKEVSLMKLDNSAFTLAIDNLYECYLNRIVQEESKTLVKSIINQKDSKVTIQETILNLSSIRHPLEQGLIERGYASDIMPTLWNDYKQVESDPIHVTKKVPFGMYKMDVATNGGFRRNKIYLIYGDTNAGKTTFMANIAYNQAVLGYKVLFICAIETEYKELINMWVSRASLLDNRTIERGGLTTDARKILKRTMELIHQRKDLPYVVFRPGKTIPTDIKNEIVLYRGKFGYNPDVVFLDYANLVTPIEQKWKQSSDRYDALFTELSSVASEEQVALITAVQQSREGTKKKKDEELGLSDIGLSNQIAPHCALVIKILQEFIDSSSGLLNAFIQKQRGGAKNLKIPLMAIWNRCYIGDQNLLVSHLVTPKALQNAREKFYAIRGDDLGREDVQEITEAQVVEPQTQVQQETHDDAPTD